MPVVAGKVEQKDTPIYLDGLGTVQAFNTVTVHTRVDGELQKVLFTEGQDVKTGDLLAVIDPRPFQAALDQAIAKKAQDEAQLANAKVTLARNTDLLKKKVIDQQDFDTSKYQGDQFQAAVQADQAAIEAAETQLDYTQIKSPIDGRIGVRLVDVGNIVHAADQTGIVVITQMHPISVVFTLPEQNLQEILGQGGANGGLHERLIGFLNGAPLVVLEAEGAPTDHLHAVQEVRPERGRERVGVRKDDVPHLAAWIVWPLRGIHDRPTLQRDAVAIRRHLIVGDDAANRHWKLEIDHITGSPRARHRRVAFRQRDRHGATVHGEGWRRRWFVEIPIEIAGHGLLARPSWNPNVHRKGPRSGRRQHDAHRAVPRIAGLLRDLEGPAEIDVSRAASKEVDEERVAALCVDVSGHGRHGAR